MWDSTATTRRGGWRLRRTAREPADPSVWRPHHRRAARPQLDWARRCATRHRRGDAARRPDRGGRGRPPRRPGPAGPDGRRPDGGVPSRRRSPAPQRCSAAAATTGRFGPPDGGSTPCRPCCVRRCSPCSAACRSATAAGWWPASASAGRPRPSAPTSPGSCWTPVAALLSRSGCRLRVAVSAAARSAACTPRTWRAARRRGLGRRPLGRARGRHRRPRPAGDRPRGLHRQVRARTDRRDSRLRLRDRGHQGPAHPVGGEGVRTPWPTPPWPACRTASATRRSSPSSCRG